MDLSQRFIYLRKSCILLHTKKKNIFLELETAAKMKKRSIPKPRSDFSTWQHSPALSSSAMTHISLSVSCRGGVQNDAPAWEILFEGSYWGLTEQPDWGGKLDDAVTLPNLFLSEVWDVEQWEIQHTPLNLSIWASVCPGLCGYDQLCILKSIL